MEHFSNTDIYLEQVGFFHKVLSLPSSYFLVESSDGNGKTSNDDLIDDTSLKKFCIETLNYDIQFWREMEYLISDMNCFVTHLVQVIIAVSLACCL